MNNNNRGNNNRRRSRGNNGRPQGGGQQLNRIDSRARGNAPQMLEKYRKLAHDAHLNGDRVTAEYYLQFADHYFRVIADTRVRQEESRGRRDDRWPENGEGSQRDDADDGNEFSVEADFPAFDQPPVYTRRDREDRGGERNAERTGEKATERSGDRPNERSNDRPAERGNDYRRRDERGPRDDGNSDSNAGDNGGYDGDQGDGEDNGSERSDSRGYEPAPITPSNNPFVRDNRGPRTARPPREDRRPRRDDRADDRPAADRAAPERVACERLPAERAPLERSMRPRREAAPAQAPAPASVGLDPSLLPPAISTTRRDVDSPADEAPSVTPRRRVRRKPVEGAGDAVETLD